ncbi:MAG TPA: hypothetical protein VF987_04200 [Rhodospirillales bacterium]|jgi:hypothetical protein
MATAADRIVSWYVGFHKHVSATPRFSQVLKLFPDSVDDLRDINRCRQMHRNAYLAISGHLDEAGRAYFVEAVDDYVRNTLRVPPLDGQQGAGTGAFVSEMKEKGYTTLPPIGRDTVAEMKSYLRPHKVWAGDYEPTEPLCELDEARSENVANYPPDTVVACPHLVDLATDPAVLAVVEGYLGTAPIILGIVGWWSFADNAGAKDAQLYHRDGDDYRFCKLFVQLTDVDEDGGPHTFVEGSHDWNTVRALREKWSGGPVEFNEWYFGTLRKADDKVERVFGRKGVKLTGPAGTRFLVDTSGIHKGTPPVKADRLMAQVLYGVTPHAQAPLLAGRFPIPAGSLKGARVPKRVADPPFDYVTWLFLT